MNPLTVYQRQRDTGMTRVDMILALYDGALERLGKAVEALARKDDREAQPLLTRCRLIVGALAGCVDHNGGEMATHFLRLYDFALDCLATNKPEKLKAALEVLGTLRDGFLAIRAEAVRLERAGDILPLGRTCVVHASA